ncbi:MAG: cytochrome b [Burkholderiales bacterium]|nr:cytochrome b [Burkholderiales bacterium]
MVNVSAGCPTRLVKPSTLTIGPRLLSAEKGGKSFFIRSSLSKSLSGCKGNFLLRLEWDNGIASVCGLEPYDSRGYSQVPFCVSIRAYSLNDSARYTHTAITFHWLIALSIFATFALGLYVSGLPFSPQRLRLISYHKWIGVTIFGLVVLRLLWRATHPAPILPAGLPAWQRRAAAASHLLLYVLMLAIPLSGWMYSSAAGAPVVYFGLLQLPDLIGADKALAQNLKLTHRVLNYTLAGIVTVHVLAALKHQFIDRDGVLARMSPFSKSAYESANEN